MIEICIYSREGQGHSITGYLVAYAALLDGKYVQLRPTWGDRGTGKPINTVVRVSDRKIRDYSESYRFDIVAVMDETLLEITNPFSNAKESAIKLVNSKKTLDGIISLDLSGIAKECGGRTAVAMAGAICGLNGLTSLESLVEAVRIRLGDDESQILTAKKGYEGVLNVIR